MAYAQSGNRVTYFLYEGSQLVAEIDATEDTTVRDNYRQTIYLGHAPIAYLLGKETYVVQSDHLGTPHRVTNSNQETVWAADYTSFGEATVTTEHITFKHRFPGQYFDGETETHYNYFRDYDPTTGRYLTSDPIGLSAGPNTFTYVSANPLNTIDLYGLNASIPTAPVPSSNPNFVQADRAIINNGQLGQWATRILQSARAITLGLARTATSSTLGPAIGVLLLANYFDNVNDLREQELVQQIGYEPTRAMYDSLLDQITIFDPLAIDAVPLYTGFQSILRAVAVLELEQQSYIQEYELWAPLGPAVCQALGLDHNVYQQALNGIALAQAAREIHENPGGLGDREEFPISDTGVTILVTPGEPIAEVLVLGTPVGINIEVRHRDGGGYIFVATEDDARALLDNIPAFPITPEGEISIGLVASVAGDRPTGEQESVPGEETQNFYDSFNEAREAARRLSELGEDFVPFVQEIGPFAGEITGSMSPDGQRGWRIDYDERSGFHVNWWNYNNSNRRRDWNYGANTITNGTLEDFYELLQHFP